MKLVIASGGGGHFFPALCVIEKLSKDWSVVVYGRKHSLEGDQALSLEYQTCLARNIAFESITSGRIQRRLTRHSIFSILKIPVGFFKSLFLLVKNRPDIILSFGGYISVPVSLAAFFLGIPVVIHEQTQRAGLANKFVSSFAKKVCVSWESSLPFFPKTKTVLTGNPLYIRNDSVDISLFPSSRNIPVIAVLGGSTGSHVINILLSSIMEKLLEKYCVIIQTGDSQNNDYDRLKSVAGLFPEVLKNRLTIIKFIDPGTISWVIKKSALVVSRGGINTITQLIYFRKPSLIVPLPVSQKNEQLDNGNFLKSLGLGEVLRQQDLTAQKLLEAIQMMMQKIKSYSLQHQKVSFPQNPEDSIIKILMQTSL